MKKVTIQFAGGELAGPCHDHNWEKIKKDAAEAGSHGVIVARMVKGEIVLNLGNVLFIGADEMTDGPGLVAAGADALKALGTPRNQ